MATPNHLPLGENRVFLTDPSVNNRANPQGEIPTWPPQTDPGEGIRAWLKDGTLSISDRGLTGTESLPSVMILFNEGEPTPDLRGALNSCPLQVKSLKSCREAAQKLSQQRMPVTIFTDISLPDGDWKQVLRIAQEAPVPVQVIVVSRIVDVHLYLDVLDAGAFDFIVPPFRAADLDYILVNAFRACLKHQLSPACATH